MRALNKYLAVIALSVAGKAFALPLGFGQPPGGLEYDELKSKHFYIYHDHRAPHEAQNVLNALEAARPSLERWFAKPRDGALPVIMSATTDEASFANFITDALEIQSMGLAHRDLAWHEYIHNNMYRHFNNWLGPAGSVLHLMWMPSWYVEGLAEALSVSIGSDQQALIEAHHALTGRWPTYARMHSLYSSADFSYRGYAASGAFVAYLLRTGQAEKLPNFLNDYFHNSMPWYWPYSLMPFEKSLPLDNSLYTFSEKTGEQQWDAYKKAAQQHWASEKNGVFFKPPTGGQFEIDYPTTLQVEGNKAFVLSSDSDRILYRTELSFENSWGYEDNDTEEFPDKTLLVQPLRLGKQRVVVKRDVGIKGEQSYQFVRYRDDNPDDETIMLQRPGFANSLKVIAKHFVWREHVGETTRICYRRIDAKQITCPIESGPSSRIDVLSFDQQTQTMWIKQSEQHLTGDRFFVRSLKAEGQKLVLSPVIKEFKGEPVAIAHEGSEHWMLQAGTKQRYIHRVDANLNCQGSVRLNSLLMDLQATKDGHFVATVFNGNAISILKVARSSLNFGACVQDSGHTSPLVEAMRDSKPIGLATAMQRASLWNAESGVEAASEVKTPPLNDNRSKNQLDQKSEPAHWRARPIFAVPWLGADSDGAQFGLLSVPLMDHMQNEDVRLYFGYGLNSRYPNTEVSLTSTRWWTALKLDVFRYQTWNGSYFEFNNKARPSISRDEAKRRGLDSDNGVYDYAYVDEKGVRLTASTTLHSLQSVLNVGMKSSKIDRYIGPPDTREGQLNEAFVDLSKSKRWRAYTFRTGLGLNIAPDAMNSNFDYQQVAVSAAVGRHFDFLDSDIGLAIEGGGTRGKKTRELKEVYRPLQVFVPGSGARYDNFNLPIYGSGGMFVTRYGDTRGALRGSYSFPLIEDMDRLIRLFYWDSLTFDATAGLGNAWNGSYGEEDESFLGSHAYGINANFDIKGVNFHLGSSIGQVFGYFPDLYASFSFDAIF